MPIHIKMTNSDVFKISGDQDLDTFTKEFIENQKEYLKVEVVKSKGGVLPVILFKDKISSIHDIPDRPRKVQQKPGFY